MLDEPSLSRQWVARRLQRALTVERWCSPARSGLARAGGEIGRILSAQGAASRERGARLEALIREVGAEPYPSWGIGAAVARLAAAFVGAVSRSLSARAARLIAEHTLSEYRTLEAFVQDAPGVPADLAARVAPLYREAAREQQALAASDADRESS